MALTIDAVYRDYNTPSVPSSGDYRPPKADIRRLLKSIVGGTAAVGDYRGPWDSGDDYIASDLVENGGAVWYALVDNDNVTPVEGATWSLFLPGTTVADGAITRAKLATSVSASVARNVKEFGAVGNGSTDDTAALQAALDYAKANNVALFVPSGRYKVTSTLTFHTTLLSGTFSPGLILVGEGHRSSILVNAIVAGGATLDLYSTVVTTFQQGGCVADIGFEDDGSGANSHGIEYEGVWNSKFERLRMEGLNGSGFKVNNPGDGDGKSSAHVRISDCYIRENAGPAWNSQGGNGGVSNHTIENCYIVGNGGLGQVVIDGVGHLKMHMCSVADFGSTVPLVRILKTNLYSFCLQFNQGEYGNDCGTHFAVDGVINFVTDGIRHVRRTGEDNSRYGYYFSDDASGVHKGIVIRNPQLEIEHDSPDWTFVRAESGVSDITVLNPITTSFETNNIKYSIVGTALAAKLHLEDFEGVILVRRPLLKNLVTPSSTSTITPNLLEGAWWQVIPSGAGTYTIAVPTGPVCDGTRITISVYKTAAINISFAAAYTIRDTIANDVVTTIEFVYDDGSGAWRQV